MDNQTTVTPKLNDSQPIITPQAPKPKISLPLIIAVILVLLAIGGAGAFYFLNSNENKPSEEEQVACSMEAKICPDGSAVGRQSPTCEFAPCPTQTPEEKTEESTPSAPQTMYSNPVYKYSFSYNSNLIYEKSSTPEENVIETLYFNPTKPANEENNVFIASLSGLNLETEKSKLTTEDESYSSKPTFSSKNINGINVTTATTAISMDGKVVYTLYVALVPIGKNTLRFISDIEEKPTVDKVLATLQTG